MMYLHADTLLTPNLIPFLSKPPSSQLLHLLAPLLGLLLPFPKLSLRHLALSFFLSQIQNPLPHVNAIEEI